MLFLYVCQIIESRETDSSGRYCDENDSKQSIDLVGNVSGKDVVIVEDIIDSGKTLQRAAQKLREEGARNITAFSTHGMYGKQLDRVYYDLHLD